MDYTPFAALRRTHFRYSAMHRLRETPVRITLFDRIGNPPPLRESWNPLKIYGEKVHADSESG
jgi:hypothetical protein